MDTHTETQETTSQTVIRKDESFTFFTNQADETPTMITQTRQVEGIGPLTVTASQIDDQDKWQFKFEMQIPPPKTKKATSQPIEGNPGENLAMLATLKSLSPDFTGVLHRASLGRIQEKGGQRFVVFDRWYPVDPSIEKSKIRTQAERKQGQPLEAPDGSYVRYIKFKLV